MFSDNFIDLLPNESTSITINMIIPKEDTGNLNGTLIVEGPNVGTTRISLIAAQRAIP
jgi:hypothetical protein